jgi:hypothetical protein
MKCSFAILTLSLALFFSGCAKPYEASFVAAVAKEPPPSKKDVFTLYHPPSFHTHAAIITSPDFWLKYVLPQLGPAASPQWRDGVSVSMGKCEKVGDTLTFEFVIRIREGGEKVFDAICDSYEAPFDDLVRKLRDQELAHLRADLKTELNEYGRAAIIRRLSEVESWQSEVRILSRKKP